jgi:hypothetical protein
MMMTPQRCFAGDDIEAMRSAGASIATTPRANANGKLFSLTRQFCSSISSAKPVFLPFTDMTAEITGDGTGLGHCHANVAWLVRQYGGTTQHGWLIWQDGNHILDAEFHACWVRADDVMLDVSKRLGNEELALFLPDHKRKFDWVNMISYNNITWDLDAKKRVFMGFDCNETRHERLYLDHPRPSWM